MKHLIQATIGMALSAAFVQGQNSNPSKAAIPVEPVGAILDAFRSHDLVGLGNVEGGNEQSHAFQLSLIRDPRFGATVNDIVVEFGNARYQDIMDRFVGGEEVPYDSLRQVWQNTTQVEYEWDLPIYEDFFRTVRAVNASLSRTRQLRVLLGDPPIDWEQVHSPRDLHQAMDDREGKESMAGLYQAVTYHAGLSGGSWLLSSIVANGFEKISTISEKLWQTALVKNPLSPFSPENLAASTETSRVVAPGCSRLIVASVQACRAISSRRSAFRRLHSSKTSS